MIKIDRDDLTATLRNGIVGLIFKKKDGTLRTIRATLRSDLLPPKKTEEEGSTKIARRKSETALPIFDLELKEWRSVRLNSIMMISSF